MPTVVSHRAAPLSTKRGTFHSAPNVRWWVLARLIGISCKYLLRQTERQIGWRSARSCHRNISHQRS